jgi:acetylornithine/succinyldiaminopimelate/putrescine aminotransferase
MTSRRTEFVPVAASLADVTGAEYAESVCRSRAWLTGGDAAALRDLAFEPVEFLPDALYSRLVSLLSQVGERVVSPAGSTCAGCSTRAFDAATHCDQSPVSGLGWYRLGENGVLRVMSKSEHYHASLGHSFPGYGLIDRARSLGIPNATHNNTRGHICRLSEEALIRVANGMRSSGDESLESVLAEPGRRVLNRVLNLQTGSLAAEAALKLCLARFYPQSDSRERPEWYGKTPVFVVIGDDSGGLAANYHGTTVTAQMLRGLWPSYLQAHRMQGMLEVQAVRPNENADLDRIFDRYAHGHYRIAGFVHEIIMMNYGARTLSTDFLNHAYSLCDRHDVVTVVDEIQSCVWGDGLFSFREWGLSPSVVVVGKGFPGGEYAGSRILFSSALDCMEQFGALVTNGQEELTSLAYLVTMRWAEANRDVIREVGDYYAERLEALADAHSDRIQAVSGHRHLSGLVFEDVEPAQAFARELVRQGFDISVQSYKRNCPPVALTKLPVIAGFELVDFLVERMESVLSAK